VTWRRPAAQPALRWAGPLAALALLCAPTPESHAHRLDEYLQATLIGLSPGEVRLEMSLTAGVQVASSILARVDLNHDDHISSTEGKAYARSLLRELVLEVDGHPRALRLSGSWFPRPEDMRAGLGSIRLTAMAKFLELRPGEHQLFLQNHHLTNQSVYLVNALAPASRRVNIVSQRRDPRQTEVRIQFSVVGQD